MGKKMTQKLLMECKFKMVATVLIQVHMYCIIMYIIVCVLCPLCMYYRHCLCAS